MSSRVSRKSSISVFHREQNSPSISGDQEIRRAFDDRDIKALEAALKQYPGSWNTNLAYLDPNYDIKYDGPASHFAVCMNWGAALRVLQAAGDPLTTNHPYSGRTPLGQAIALSKPSLVRALLKLGAPLTAKEMNGPIISMLLREGVNSKKQQVAAELVKAGMHPWRSMNDHVEQQTQVLPELCIEYDQISVAAYLAGLDLAPPRQNDSIFTTWMKKLNVGRTEHHLDLLNNLGNQGWVPDISLLLGSVENSDKTASAYAGQLSPRKVLFALINRRAEMGIGEEDARAALAIDGLHDYPELEHVLITLSQQVLAHTTPMTTQTHRKSRL